MNISRHRLFYLSILPTFALHLKMLRFMDTLVEYIIPHKGLSDGMHSYRFEVNDTFFENFESSLIQKGFFVVDLQLEKTPTMLILNMHIDGTYQAVCDRCVADIQVPLQGSRSVMIKYADDAEDEDEIIFISPLEHQVNLANIIHETIMLAKPIANLKDCEAEDYKDCDEAILDKLDDDLQQEQAQGNSTWDALKNINFES